MATHGLRKTILYHEILYKLALFDESRVFARLNNSNKITRTVTARAGAKGPFRLVKEPQEQRTERSGA